MKLASCVFACLIDGKAKRLGDLLPYLVRRVKPNIAVKTFMAAPRYDRNASLKKQIESGSRRVVGSSINNMLHAGKITVTKAHSRTSLEDFVIQITKKGMDTVLSPSNKPESAVSTQAWNELKSAVRKGWLSIKVDITNGELDNYEDVKLPTPNSNGRQTKEGQGPDVLSEETSGPLSGSESLPQEEDRTGQEDQGPLAGEVGEGTNSRDSAGHRDQESNSPADQQRQSWWADIV